MHMRMHIADKGEGVRVLLGMESALGVAAEQGEWAHAAEVVPQFLTQVRASLVALFPSKATISL